ncbi:HAD family hydrolase [Mangrovibacterium marinum]|uniref:Putative hydrolase of the HAD superfamily n=1 Tax=Mangrovibacterium marinum TaxID=1639118 RepID=A0A2T5C2Y5_9BACT|nr:HAD family hydrolase [Mangrovibacterium marinum]PTN09078.1 putative hydrolase of the HAD superfamily [Mangrovibacterium marinum]
MTTQSYLNHLEPFLKAIKPMELIPTGAEPYYRRDKGIKALIFDIYGTLIISASGDIMQAGYDASMFKRSLDASGFEILVPDSGLMTIHTLFEEEVTQGKEAAKAAGTPFPELNIVEIWRKTLSRAEDRGLIKGIDKADLRLFTFIFELSSNQVWPMPKMTKTIDALREKGYPLGIVSNAQFYTPVMMNYFFSGKIHGEEFLDGFERDLSVFSYKMLKGKPDTAVYEALVEPLAKRGLKPSEVLYVGNDMLKDMYASQQVGFKTCFYAGDMRAYRLRKDHPQASKTKPDYVITELSQLLEIV